MPGWYDLPRFDYPWPVQPPPPPPRPVGPPLPPQVTETDMRLNALQEKLDALCSTISASTRVRRRRRSHSVSSSSSVPRAYRSGSGSRRRRKVARESSPSPGPSRRSRADRTHRGRPRVRTPPSLGFSSSDSSPVRGGKRPLSPASSEESPSPAAKQRPRELAGYSPPPDTVMQDASLPVSAPTKDDRQEIRQGDVTRLQTKMILDWFRTDKNAKGLTFGDPVIMAELRSSLFPEAYVREKIRSQAASSATGISPQASGDGAGLARPNSPAPPGLSPVQPVGPAQSAEGTEESPENLRAKQLIRQVLTEGLALTGNEPVSLPQEDKRPTLSPWGDTLDGVVKPQEEKLAWPVHFRVKDIRAAITSKLGSLAPKEATVDATRYDRVPDSIVPLTGPRYLWLSGPDPGWSDKLPSNIEPLQSSMAVKNDRVAGVQLQDLRAVQASFKQITALSSVLSHSLDIFAKVLPQVPDGPDKTLANTTMEVARTAASTMAAVATQRVISHTIFERHRAQNRDDRYDFMSLPAEVRAAARLGPVDSDVHVFGSHRTWLETQLKARREDLRSAVLSRPLQVDTHGNLKNQPFRAQSSAKGKGSRASRGGKVPSRSKASEDKSRAEQDKENSKPKPKKGSYKKGSKRQKKGQGSQSKQE